MNLHKKLLYTSLVVITVGVAGMVPYANMWAERQAALANPQSTVAVSNTLPQKPTLVTGKPVRLEVPSLGIDLVVADGAYDANTHEWTLSKDKAHFALPTIQPNNETGNTLIYGHNRNEVFTKLLAIESGAQAYVTTDNGYRFTYTMSGREKVAPNDVSIFAYQGASRLTLQTCSGAWYQDREFFYFSYQSHQQM